VCGLSVLQDGSSVKYLGIPFARHDMTTQVIDSLENALQTSAAIWLRRARTVQGRRLLASSVILSRLWHVSVHVNIDLSRVRKWQTCINKFILRGASFESSRGLHLIPNAYLYAARSEYGLQFPQIESSLRQQRLLLLQHFTRHVQAHPVSSSTSFDWTSVAQVLLCASMRLYRCTTATDFLWVNPTLSKAVLKLHYLPAWWQQTWRQWCRQRWPLVNPAYPTHLFHAPIWLNSDNKLRYQVRSRIGDTSSRSYCVGQPSQYHRPFRQWFAQASNKSTLHDFVCPSTRRWPSLSEFCAYVNRLLGNKVWCCCTRRDLGLFLATTVRSRWYKWMSRSYQECLLGECGV